MFSVFFNRFFESVLGSLPLFTRCSWYFSLEDVIAFDISCVSEFKMAEPRLSDFLWLWNIHFFSLNHFLISSFIQGGSLPLHTVIWFGIKLWKIFSNVLLNSSIYSWTFLSENNFDQSKLPVEWLIKFVSDLLQSQIECKVEDIQFLN